MEKIKLAGMEAIEVTCNGAMVWDADNGEVKRKMDCPCAVTISKHENVEGLIILAISVGNITLFAEFNSDFPLLFNEGVNLWNSL